MESSVTFCEQSRYFTSFSEFTGAPRRSSRALRNDDVGVIGTSDLYSSSLRMQGTSRLDTMQLVVAWEREFWASEDVFSQLS